MRTMQLYHTRKGNLLKSGDNFYVLTEDWDQLINRPELFNWLDKKIKQNPGKLDEQLALSYISSSLLSPVGSQELWAAGVTYLRSRDARMEESQQSGGADFYQRVYEAERPELFFKALPHRISGHGQEVNIRRDSTWNVPEPELTVFINSTGSIQGYTIGNDMSSRSIEGENPLYLPQAKTYEKSAALGPCLLVADAELPAETMIRLLITRNGKEVFNNHIQLNRMKRKLPELAQWLFRECDFASGCFLMTGTGIVPPNDFTLLVGDEVSISIGHIGTLTNRIAMRPG